MARGAYRIFMGSPSVSVPLSAFSTGILAGYTIGATP
jgi:hypothetical protein